MGDDPARPDGVAGPGAGPRILSILGPTASGKSSLAMALARSDPRVELVSIDSMQVYRGMDIGTAKPTVAERAEVRHHLIDLVDPGEEFTAGEFQDAAKAAIADIERRGGVPVLVGGTGLHLRTIVDDLDIPGRFPEVLAELEAEPTEVLFERLQRLDPVAATRMEPTNRRRALRALEVTLGSGRRFSDHGPGLDHHPPTRFHMVGLVMPRSLLDRRIEARYAVQMDAGFVDEVRRLAAAPGGLSATARQALGYRQLLEHIEGRIPLDEALQDAIRATRQFARRQERWFRRDPRITWIEVGENPMEAFDSVMGEWRSCT